MRKNLWVLLTPIAHFLLSYLMLFTYWPEMLNYPFFILRGLLPYRDFSMVYTPLLPVAMAGIYNLLGHTPATLHLVASALLFLTNLLLCLIIYRLTKSKLFAISLGLLFVYISLSFEANALWFDSLLTVFYLLIFYLQLEYLHRPKALKIFLMGTLSGLAFLTKQSSLYVWPTFLLFFGYLYLRHQLSPRRLIETLIIFTAPILILTSLFIAGLLYLGIINDFINWGVKFILVLTSMHGKNLSPDIYLPPLKFLVTFAPLYVVALFATYKAKTFLSFLALSWMLLSTLIIFPRFGFFHLEPALAFFFITISVALVKTKASKKYLAAVGALILVLATPVLIHVLRHGQSFYDKNAISVSDWILTNYPDASIYSLNGPDIVYSLTNKLPSVIPWVDQLSWNMAFFGDRYLEAFSKKPPDLIIFVPYKNSQYQPEAVVAYVTSHYQPLKTFPSGVKILKKFR